MIIEGSAYSLNGLRAEHEVKYQAVKRFKEDITFKWAVRHDETAIDFKGTINSLEALNLSELDIALLISSGQIDFGATCSKVGNVFTGVINLG